MITDDGKKWYYLKVKSISALLRGITSNNHGDFYCLNCLHSYRTKEKFKKHEKACNNHDYCYVKVPNEFEKILKYNSSWKFLLWLILSLIKCKKFVIAEKKKNLVLIRMIKMHLD